MYNLERDEVPIEMSAKLTDFRQVSTTKKKISSGIPLAIKEKKNPDSIQFDLSFPLQRIFINTKVLRTKAKKFKTSEGEKESIQFHLCFIFKFLKLG